MNSMPTIIFHTTGELAPESFSPHRRKTRSLWMRAMSIAALSVAVMLLAGCGEKKSTEDPGQGNQGDGSYELFETYRAAAIEGKPYPGLPGKGKKLGFANIYGTQPFCISVEKSIIAHARRAGFSEENIIIMDNQYKADIALKNADIMLSKRPDVFIEFQADENVNHIVSRKFKAAGIPVIAIDVPVPGAPFMGVDNWGMSRMGGKEMARLIKTTWGGWDAVDMVLLLQMPSGGEITMRRSEGFAKALVEEFGQKAEKKIVRADGGMGQTEQAKAAMDDVLATHPKAKKIAITSINEQTMAGVIASLQGAGRWNEEDIIIISLGVDELGQSQIRDGSADAGIASFPETYGQYVIPAVCALLQGKSVPPEILVNHKVITKKNIDEYYPRKK
jgi:ribose transport system substrate-binding protein